MYYVIEDKKVIFSGNYDAAVAFVNKRLMSYVMNNGKLQLVKYQSTYVTGRIVVEVV